jgi:hypothetical protein
MNRRSLLFAIPLFAGAHFGSSLMAILKQGGSIERSDVDELLNTTQPELHCTMNHDHKDTTFDDWERSLKWSAADCGHNEGAGPVIKLAVKNGLSYPELMCGCPQSEALIPQVEEARKDPDTLDRYIGLASSSQIAEVKKMLRQGTPPPEILASSPEETVGEVWRRKAMIRFASTLARKGSVAAGVAIATASQWHNCSEFKCLLRHPNEVGRWLRGQTAQECRLE